MILHTVIRAITMIAMKLHNSIHTIKGIFEVEYQDADTFKDLPISQCSQAYGICFCQNSIVLCRTITNSYILPGGTVEPGETLIQALIREVQEESNMRVLAQLPIGYQKVFNQQTAPFYQVRYVALVEPYGPFIADPDNHIKHIELVSQEKAAALINWGEIGTQLFTRAKQKHSVLLAQ
jgi:ADP-ribose pyrophosphatase YjhB (NUDIX family)